jgi:hypothetical protein
MKVRLVRAQEKLADRTRRLAQVEMALTDLRKVATGDASVRAAAGIPDPYCVKCRAKRSPLEVHPVVLKNGRRALQGGCPACGTTLTLMLRGPEPRPTTV